MKQNVGSVDRWLRGAGGVLLALFVLVVSMPLPFRVLGVAHGAYLVLTAFAGYCVGYRLLGRSTCPLQQRR